MTENNIPDNWHIGNRREILEEMTKEDLIEEVLYLLTEIDEMNQE